MHAIKVALQIAAVAVMLLWLLTRTPVCRLAMRRLLWTPALLVPAAMAGVVAILIASWGGGAASLIDQPLRLPAFDRPWSALVLVWFGTSSAAIAGQIGVLEAMAAGRHPDGHAFSRGIARHLVTILLARSLIAVAGLLLARFLTDRTTPAWVLALLPNLFLVPVIGIASRHPGRPIHAVLSTLRFAQRRIGAVGGPLLCHALLLLGLCTARRRFDGLDLDPRDVAAFGSGLSYNLGLFGPVADSPLAAVVASIASLIGTTVFATAQWIGVHQGYQSTQLEGFDRGSATA